MLKGTAGGDVTMKITQSGLFSTGKWDYFQGEERVTSSDVSSGLSIPHIMPILCVIMWILAQLMSVMVLYKVCNKLY